MIRHTSNQQETIRKSENRAKVMSTTNMFSPEIAAEYGRKAVELESRGNGDQLNALERVGRECGLKARALRRIINGETSPNLSVFVRIRTGYLNICDRHVKRLQQEIEEDKRKYGDAAFADIGDEVQALVAKVQEAKKGRR